MELTPHAALHAIDEALRFERSLRSRTEGLTWMVWGLVAAATFLSYEAATPLFYGDGAFAPDDPHEDSEAPWWLGGLWVPWLGVGVMVTYALWRSAALASPALRQKPRHAWVPVAWIACVALGWLLALLAFPRANPSVYPVLGLGTAWVLLGVLDVYRATPLGRRVTTAIGAAIFLAGLLMAATVAPGSASPSGAAAGHLGAVVTGLVPLLGGLYQTLRD